MFSACFELDSCSTFSKTLKMEAIYSSEMFFDFHRAAQCYILEDRTFHNHRSENFKYYKYYIIYTTVFLISNVVGYSLNRKLF
jgi:hypothetical protein